MGGNKGSSKARALESLRDAKESIQEFTGHAEEAYSDFWSGLKFRYKSILVVVFAVIASVVTDFLTTLIGTTVTNVIGIIQSFLSIRITALSLVLLILYLQLTIIILLVIGFNGLASKIEAMNSTTAATDGGRKVKGSYTLTLLRISILILGALLGAILGQPYGMTWLFVGAALGAFLTNELFRRASEGSLFGGALL